MTWMVFIILLLTALSASGIGTFLTLRCLSMITDAISHSVLLGIVLAYFVTKDLDSPFLVVGATVFGLITVYAIESLANSGLVKNDDAVGIIFPLFFALAVILISRYASNVHLDVDVVLMGEVILAPLNTMNFFGLEVPKALVYSSFTFILNSIFIAVFFKELKITTFDPDFASLSGFPSTFLFYTLMTLASLTAVVSFNSVGAILVISFFIAAPATAFLISKDLKVMLILSGVFSLVNSLLGFLIGNWLNVSISGMTASIAGLVFILVWLFNREGVITQIYKRREDKKDFKAYLMLLHIGNHSGTAVEKQELSFNTINEHLNWTKEEATEIADYLSTKDFISANKGKQIYELTDNGRSKYQELVKEYSLS